AVSMRPGGDLVLANGRTLTLNANSSLTFAFGGNTSQQIRAQSGTATVLFNGGASNANIGQSSNSTLTIAPGILLTGTGNASVSVNTLVNQGTFSQGTVGRAFNFNVTSFTNQGTITAGASNSGNPDVTITATNFSNSGSLVANGGGRLRLTNNAAGTWSNTGLIQAGSTGTVDLDGAGGSITTAFFNTLDGTQGTLRLLGILNNNSATLNPGAGTGSLILDSGARIQGGTIQGGTGGSTLTIAPSVGVELDGVQLVDMDLSVPANSSVSMRPGGDLVLANGRTLTLNANSSLTFAFGGNTSQQIRAQSGTATVLFNGGASNANIGQSSNSTLTIAPGILLTGTGNASVSVNTLVNQGTFSQGTAGRAFNFNVSNF